MQRANHKLLGVCKVLDINQQLGLVMIMRSNGQLSKFKIKDFEYYFTEIDPTEAERKRYKIKQETQEPLERLKATRDEVKAMFHKDEDLELEEMALEMGCSKGEVASKLQK